MLDPSDPDFVEKVKDDEDADYSQMTDDEFRRILEDIIDEERSNILSIGDVYSILAEHYNNEILDEWVCQNPDAAYPEEKNE